MDGVRKAENQSVEKKKHSYKYCASSSRFLII